MKPAFCKISPVNINGKGTNRLMVVLKTKGCEYAQKNNGGCTVCGFLNHAQPDITGEKILEQLDYTLTTFDLREVEEIDILTLGSFFNDSEVSQSTRSQIITRLSTIPNLIRVSIESRAEYVTVDKIKQIKEILGNDKILEFAIGLESQDDYLRNKIIKKGLSKKAFENTVARVKAAGANFLTYLLIKPPHVLEKDAIDDAVKSAAYVFQTAKKYNVPARVAFEPVFVCENTYLEELYLQSKYRLLNLWSVVEVIKNAHQYGGLFVGLSDEDLSLERMPHSCPICSGKIVNAVERFNRTQDVTEINMLDCQCKSQYIKRREKGEI